VQFFSVAFLCANLQPAANGRPVLWKKEQKVQAGMAVEHGEKELSL